MIPSGRNSPIYEVLRRFLVLLSRLFHGRPFGKRQSPPLHAQAMPPVPQDTGQVDWSARNAMVGTVRSREQLRYNLKNNCYYVPARFLRSEHTVAYIALHERDEEDIPCILRIGRVVAAQQVERRTIPVTMRKETDPGEPYLYYTIEEWTILPHRILIRDTARGKPLFTNKFLLEHCRASYELFVISSPEEYRLLEGIYALLSHQEETCRITEERKLTLHKDELILTDPKGTPLCKLSAKTYIATPRTSFLRLKKHL